VALVLTSGFYWSYPTGAFSVVEGTLVEYEQRHGRELGDISELVVCVEEGQTFESWGRFALNSKTATECRSRLLGS
jgi:hypothetical protein